MSNNVSTVNLKTLLIIVLIAILTAAFLVYGFPQSSNANVTTFSYENYYYEPHVPQEGQKVVCIVFDDGWISQYTTALPILDEYGFKATFAIITNYVGNLEYMDWSNITTLQNQGHDIESHTANHRTLTSQDMDSIDAQLSQSKQDLLKHGINAPLFIYPQGEGAGDPSIESLVQQHYYAARGITHSSLDMSQPFDPYALPGYTVGNATTLDMFKRYVDQAADSTVVIVYYHDISYKTASTSITPEDFAAQMQYLHDNNFTVQTLKQLFTSTTTS